MSRRYARTIDISASRAEVFARLDDQTRLAEHMERASAMMGGGRMTYDFDEDRGMAVGSHIRMGGEAFGLSLFVDEVVTDREPPRRKAWRTDGPTRLLIMAGYAMGFALADAPSGARLTVWIDYDPLPGLKGLLAAPLAALYARWCVDRMASDAAGHFAARAAAPAGPRSQPA